jgi:hypothetical protein
MANKAASLPSNTIDAIALTRFIIELASTLIKPDNIYDTP